MTKIYCLFLIFTIPIISFSQTHEFRQSSGSMLGTMSSSTDDAILTLSRGQIDDRGGIVFDLQDKFGDVTSIDYDFWEVGVRDGREFKISRYTFPRLSGGTYTDAITLNYDQVSKKSKLGINTDSPSEILDVVNGSNSMTMDGLNLKWKTSGLSQANFAYGFGNFIFTNSNATFTTPTASKFQINNITSSGIKTQFRVDYDGDVGIGNDIGAIPSSVYLEHKRSVPDGSSAEVLINAATSGVKIQNNGTNNKYISFYVSDATGDLNIYSNVSNTPIARISDHNGGYSSLSDVRHKRNIKALYRVSSKIEKLKPATYNFNSQTDTEKRQIGMMAQDLIKYFPEVVTHDLENDLYHVEYGALSTIAIKAIQEQQEIITALKEELQIIKTEVQLLKRNNKK